MPTVNDLVIGYIGAVCASIFFGSNYVPTKKYPTGDGMTFVWIFSCGVMCVGFIAMIINGEAIFVPTGLLGGTLWTMGNLCVIPIIQCIGFGLGGLLWGGTSLITGFFSGKFGWFGLKKDDVQFPLLNWLGILMIFISMLVFFCIKPELEPESKSPFGSSRKSLSINSGEEEKLPFLEDDEDVEQGEHIIHVSKRPEPKLADRVPKKFRPFVGIFLAIFSGILYGVNLVPYKLWEQEQDPAPKPLAFILSHFTGIFLFSTVVWIVYSLVKRPPQVFPQTMLPSFVSGAMWGIAQCGLIVATGTLGFTIGFPIGSAGPSIVNALWSVFAFREIRGKKNLSLLVVAFLFQGAGIGLLSKSH